MKENLSTHSSTPLVDSSPIGATGVKSGGEFFDNLTWLTTKEAAEYLRLPSVNALRNLVYKRIVPYRRFGRHLRFKKTELDSLIDNSIERSY